MTCLQNVCHDYFFHDIEKEPLEDIVNFSNIQNLLGKVSTYCGDSISTFLFAEYRLSKGDFVFLDPYSPYDNNVDGYNFFDVFVKASISQAMTMFWYGCDSLEGKARIAETFDKIKSEPANSRIHTFDIWLSCMQQDSCKMNPGVPGCGIAIANLSRNSIAHIIEYQKTIERIYKNAFNCGEKASLSIIHEGYGECCA